MFTLKCHDAHSFLLLGGLLVLPRGNLAVDPAFQLVVVDRRQRGLVGPQIARAAQIDVYQIVSRRVGVPVDQHADATRQPARHVHLVAAEQRRVQPAELAGRQGGVLRGQVARRREDDAGHVVGLDTVEVDHQRQQPAGFAQDRFGGVFIGGGGAADASIWHMASNALHQKSVKLGASRSCRSVNEFLVRTPLQTLREARVLMPQNSIQNKNRARYCPGAGAVQRACPHSESRYGVALMTSFASSQGVPQSEGDGSTRNDGCQAALSAVF